MQLFVMRHGEAEPQIDRDKDRALTQNGLAQAEVMAKWLSTKTDGFIDYAMVSSYKRAQQTFQQIANQIDVSVVEDNNDMLPPSNASLFADYLGYWRAQHPQARTLLLVSHMPFVSYLLDELCSQPYSKLFATASIAHLQWDADSGGGQLISLQHPNQLNL